MFKSRAVANWKPSSSCSTMLIVGIVQGFVSNLLLTSWKSLKKCTVLSMMTRSLISVTLYFCCITESFLLKNAISRFPWVIMELSFCLRHQCRFQNLSKMWGGQNNILCNGCLYSVKCLLMDHVPVSGCFLCSCFLGDFGLAALSNKGCKWGKHFASSCPKILVVLYHSKESSQMFDFLRQL